MMAETQELRVAILVVSDTAAADPSTDRSLETLKAVFDQDGGNPWSIIERKIVPDDIMDIRRSIIHWTDRAQPISLILTTGGTGFAVRDNTPEVRSLATVNI
jgi:gephyrin